MATVGRRVAELRRQRGLSQEALAGLLDRDPRWLARIEAGGQNVTIRTLVRLANALDVHAADLLRAGRREGA